MDSNINSDTDVTPQPPVNRASLSLTCAVCGADIVQLYNDLHLPLKYETWWGADGQPHCAPLKEKAALRAEHALEKCSACAEVIQKLDSLVCARLKERKLDGVRAHQEFRADCARSHRDGVGNLRLHDPGFLD